MLRSFTTSIARFALPLVFAAAAGTAVAQTLSYGNSPGGYPGNVSYAGGAGSLQSGTPIDLIDWHFSDSVRFTFQTGATVDGGWTFSGGTVSMVVSSGWGGGIDLNGDFAPDILPGTTLFTGILGTTTVRDRRGPPDEYGNRYEIGSPYIGSNFDISASFTTSDLHTGYAAALGVPTSNFTGSFLLGIDSWNGGPSMNQVGWRQVSMTLNQQTAPIPEPETYAMMLAGLGLLGVAARRRKQKVAA